MILKYNQPKQDLTVAENLNEIFTTKINLQKNITEFQQFQRISLEEDTTTLRLQILSNGPKIFLICPSYIIKEPFGNA